MSFYGGKAFINSIARNIVRGKQDLLHDIFMFLNPNCCVVVSSRPFVLCFGWFFWLVSKIILSLYFKSVYSAISKVFCWSLTQYFVPNMPSSSENFTNA